MRCGPGEAMPVTLRQLNILLWRPLIALLCGSFTVAYFTKEVNPSLAKQPLKFNGGFAKLGLTSIVK